MLSRIFFGGRDPLVEAAASQRVSGPRFSTVIDSGVLYGTLTAPDPWGVPGQRVTRTEAVAVPAVKRARDLICGAIGQMPLQLVGPDGGATEWSLFDQPESGTPRSVTLTRLAEDLLFESRCWWRVTHTGWHGKPAEVIRLEPTSVTVQPDSRVYYSRTGNGMALQFLPDDQLIRFDSPNDALLVAGARAIRAMTRLEQAALNQAEGVPPMDYFTPAEGADPAEDEDITDLLEAWATARKTRSTAYVPAALAYHSNAFNPEQLQMAQAREFAITEIARLTSIDAEELSVSTTSRTYANIQDRRRQFLDFTLGPLMTAIEDRLSMNDVSPRGYRARFDTATFLRADDQTRAETDKTLIDAGVLRPEEARDQRGLTGAAPERPTLPARTQEAADA
ncbi:UNVERIFIED_CONTAM: hypothetical protein LK11_06580 [Mumia flava]